MKRMMKMMERNPWTCVFVFVATLLVVSAATLLAVKLRNDRKREKKEIAEATPVIDITSMPESQTRSLRGLDETPTRGRGGDGGDGGDGEKQPSEASSSPSGTADEGKKKKTKKATRA